MEDYKEKYEMALEGIQEILSSGEDSIKMSRLQLRLQGIFPELKESEDEKIRKALIKGVESCKASGWTNFGNNVDIDVVLAWLEKQGKVDTVSYEVAENEKREFVGDGFIKCYADFQDFKEGETYWLEYVGKDNYNVRSDNLLGKTYHITPCQLYTIFKKQTWVEKQSHNNNQNWKPSKGQINALEHFVRSIGESGYGSPYDDNTNLLNSLINDLYKLEKQGEQKPVGKGITGKQEDWTDIPFGAKDSELIEERYYIPKGFHAEIDDDKVVIKKGEKPAAWSDEDEHRVEDTIYFLDTAKKHYASTIELDACIDWLKSLKQRIGWKPSKEQMDALIYVVQHYTPDVSDNLGWGSIKTLELMYYEIKKIK